MDGLPNFISEIWEKNAKIHNFSIHSSIESNMFLITMSCACPIYDLLSPGSRPHWNWQARWIKQVTFRWGYTFRENTETLEIFRTNLEKSILSRDFISEIQSFQNLHFWSKFKPLSADFKFSSEFWKLFIKSWLSWILQQRTVKCDKVLMKLHQNN